MAGQDIAFVALVRIHRLPFIVDGENGQERRNGAVVAVDDERIRRIVIHADKLSAFAHPRKKTLRNGRQGQESDLH